MDTQHRRNQPWCLTHAEVYDLIYMAIKHLLKHGGVMATLFDGKVMILSNENQIRQGGHPSDIQIRIPAGWINVDDSTVDEWAKSLDVIGPSDHFIAVERAIGVYPVPPHVVTDYASLAGLDKQGQKHIKKPQLTRTVDVRGSLIGQFMELPKPSEEVDYTFSNNTKRVLKIGSVLAYRPYDLSWLVAVSDANYRFVIQRMVLSDETKRWITFIRN